MTENRAITQEEVDAARAAMDSAIIQYCVPNIVDHRPHALFDIIRVPADTEFPREGLFHFFTAPVGYSAPGSWIQKTKFDTNAYLSGYLPPPEELIINRIIFTLEGGDDETRGYLESLIFDLTLLAKRCALGELSGLLFSGGPDQFFDSEWKRNGFQPPTCFSLAKPMRLPSLAHYSFTVRGDRLLSKKKFALGVILDGEGQFAVQ